jgi:predicted nucleic acid-binding Zn ribbon protein
MPDRSNERFRPLEQLLGGEARRLKLDGSLREVAAVGLWAEVVGEQIAAATQAERVRDGVLHVIARSHTWAFELTFHREQILKGLNARLGGAVIQEIRFRPGLIHAPEAPPPPPEPAPTAAELAAITLEPGEAAAVEDEAARVADPEMQVVVRRLLTNERKRLLWQQQQGLRACASCGAMHSTPGELCPACRREGGR